MKLMARTQGIKFSKISYIPGSEVRTGALLQGNVKATHRRFRRPPAARRRRPPASSSSCRSRA